MSKEFATRNLVHNKIPEFPSGSGADRFLTKKEILDTSPFARIEGSYSDVAIPIMDNVIYAEAAFSVSRTSFQLPQNTGSESFTVTSTIGGEALAWSVSEFNASWATYSVSGNSVSVHANADQTTESQKSGYIRVKQSVTNQEITVNFTQAAGVPTYTYTFSPSTTSLSFGATANSQSISVTSYRTKYINGHQVGTENLDYSSSSPEGGLTVSGTTFSVTENVVESSRSWSVVFTQSVSGNTFTVSVTQAAGVPTYTYTFSPSTTSLSFGATANSQSISVTSYRTKYINGHQVGTENLDYSSSSPEGGLTVSGTTFSVTENVVESSRSWSVVFTQSVSGNTFTVSVTQAAASITWGHEFTSATTSLSFIATGETKRIAVNSIRRKYINGNPTTEVAAVPYTPSISGDSTFSVSSYDTSEIYIVAANNLAALQRTGTLTLSQQSSGKTLTISLSQEAGEVTRVTISNALVSYGTIYGYLNSPEGPSVIIGELKNYMLVSSRTYGYTFKAVGGGNVSISLNLILNTKISSHTVTEATGGITADKMFIIQSTSGSIITIRFDNSPSGATISSKVYFEGYINPILMDFTIER